VIARGEVWDADLGPTVRPVVIATRETAIPVLARLNCVVVTSTVRGHVAEVELTRSHAFTSRASQIAIGSSTSPLDV